MKLWGRGALGEPCLPHRPLSLENFNQTTAANNFTIRSYKVSSENIYRIEPK